MCVSFTSFAALAGDVKPVASAAEKKICEKTGKPCTGDMKKAAHDCKKDVRKNKLCKKTGQPCTGDMKKAAHDCKKGDKECSKNTAKTPVKK